MTTFESIFTAASNLSLEERARLIDQLAATMPEDYSPTLHPDWEAELDRRWQEYETGAVKTIPWEEVRRKLSEQDNAADVG